MNEGDDQLSGSNDDAAGSPGDEGSGEAATGLKKKPKIRKKKSDLGGMDGSKKAPAKLRRNRTVSSNEDGSSDGTRKPAVRRKSSTDGSRGDQSTTSTSRKDGTNSSLSLISKASAGRPPSKDIDNASAASGGSRNSGGSKKSMTRKTSRAKSPGRRSPAPNLIPPSSGARKTAPSAAELEGGAGMWGDAFGGGGDRDGDTAAKDSFSNKSDNAAAAFGAAFDSGGGVGGGFTDFGNTNDSTFADSSNSFFPSSNNGQSDSRKSNPTVAATTIPEHEAFESDTADFFDAKGDFDGGQDTGAVFGNDAVFGSSHRESLDKTPLKNPPRSKVAKLSMVKKTIFSQNFACQPVKNPLNGNIIFCTSKNGEMYIQEVDPTRGFVQVLSSPILTSELHKKVTTKYTRSAYGVDNVLKLCVGVHRSHGQPRLRVVAVIDLLVLDSKHILRAMAVWQWGYGTTNPVSLQFLLSPPSGTDYFYHPETIVAADNIVFVAGASAKGPCIFMCKPSVRESWSANFLAPSGKVTSMAVTAIIERTHPYMAVGMSDGSLSVWTYAAALKQSASKKNEPVRRLLYPLCRLDALSVLNSLQPTNFWEDKKQKADAKAEAGMCTNLEWLPPQSSLSSLLMLAAGFQGGVAVFHIALPHIADASKPGKYIPVPPPTQSTQLVSTPPIRPFAAIRLPYQLPDVFVSWIDFGPHNNPCLALLLHGRSSVPDDEPGRVVLSALNLMEYKKAAKPKESLASFRVLASTGWRSKSKAFPLGLLSCSGLNAVVCHVGEGISVLYPTLSNQKDDPSVRSLRYPVFSNPPGVDSAGEVALTDCTSDKEGILHVFSTRQCDLKKNDANPEMLSWTRPTRRHWLCRTLCGDRKETRPKEEAKEASQFDEDDEVVIGGSSSDVICELENKALSGLTPFRIVKCRESSAVAVLFRPALGNMSQGASGVCMDCVTIALLETSKKNTEIEIVEGRDIAFLPADNSKPRALVLSRDGCSVSSTTKTASGWGNGGSCRPILGVECDGNYIEAHRLFVVSDGSNYALAVVGKKHANERCCIVCGPMGTKDQMAGDEWSKGLPEFSPSLPCRWLKTGEVVLSLIALPHNINVSPQKLAVSTPTRVLILDTKLELLTESKATMASGAIAPLGSSSVAFCSSDFKIRYVSCLDRKLSSGILATLPMPKFGYGTCLLLAVRPDRFLQFGLHCGSTMAEHNDDSDCFMLPTAVTRPAMLLEPLVANAICEGAKNGNSTALLRGVIEKFGRKTASISHGENEGIGKGTGITPRVYELLSVYGLDQAASWLLTGGVQFYRSANTKILPPWMPVSAKRAAALDSDAFLHLVTNGDQYLSEYVQSPDNNMSSTLPRPGDSTSYLCREFGQGSLGRGNGHEALEMLDMAGTESHESMLLQLSLLLEIKTGDATELLKSVSGYGEQSLSSSSGIPSATTCLAALATHMKLTPDSQQMNSSQTQKWMKPLAPSLQRGTQFPRVRQRLLGEKALSSAVGVRKSPVSDPHFLKPCKESRHIWNEGPNREKESLLLLNSVEDWLGRRRPRLLGKEGVAAAEERGEGALANILDMDMDKDDEPVGAEASDDESEKKGWETGVGEGRLGEDNLSGYFRFWEGEDDENPWRTEGFSDLSRFESNKAIIVGQGTGFSLQETTSSVDEGDPGKVKILYDLVFEEAGDEPSGLALAATRGNSIDVGVLHLKERSARQRCTLEFWYYLPPPSAISGEIVLARRTFGADADDFTKVAVATDKRSMLWEIALLKTGELKFRTCGGDTFRSSQNKLDEDDSKQERKDLVAFERWNHACIVFSSRDVGSPSNCEVSLSMMGTSVASMKTSMLPPKLTLKDLGAKVDGLMEKSHLLFGLNSAVGFRLTEIRVWASERSEDDIKMMMREHLDAASMKKKFRVRIKKGGSAGGLLGPPKAGGLAPPKAGGSAPPKGLSPPKLGGLAPPKGSAKTFLGPPKGSTPARSSFLSPPKPGFLAPPKDHKEPEPVDEAGFAGFPSPATTVAGGGNFMDSDLDAGTGFEAAFGSFGSPDPQTSDGYDGFSAQTPPAFASLPATNTDDGAAWGDPSESQPQEENDAPKQSLWDSALPLSQQVRSSAAAALIRGPPATRHFGGNRGGLPDLRGTDRYGVGGIAICGSEKTIVWRDEEDPPALTYPIGASGAIVSDQLDDEEGSEFLCCFLAKDKRMVVFELNSRTVVVELQMTTKLNFWRFLPPEAAESSLCFMLITPVGGFHWMPLDDSPRPRQVWKRGSDLQGKKIVSYEEGGTNGLAGSEMISKVGLICATDSNGTGTLEAWMVPICGDSGAVLASGDVQGAAFGLPENNKGDGPFLPHLVLVIKDGDDLKLNISTILEPEEGSVAVGEVITSEILPTSTGAAIVDPPTLAMGVFPDVMVCTLGNIIVIVLRTTGTMIAYEFKTDDNSTSSVQLMTKEDVGHYVIDAVMRYSAIEGGAEIVMLLSDNDNHKDGRIVSHNFRSLA